MNLHITKSKNSESFYIAKSCVKVNDTTSSNIVHELDTLNDLLVKHGSTRDNVLSRAKNEVKIDTLNYKKEKGSTIVLIPFHADKQIDYNKQVFYRDDYLFLYASNIRCI